MSSLPRTANRDALSIAGLHQSRRFVRADGIVVLLAETSRQPILGDGARAIPGKIGELSEFLVRAASKPVCGLSFERFSKLAFGRFDLMKAYERCPVAVVPACHLTKGARPRIVGELVETHLNR
jgi:hypothetical protein